MIVEWSPVAEADRIETFSYIAQDSVQAAVRVDDAIDAQTDQLIDFPESGRPGRVVGTRELVITNLPYIVVYRLEDRRVYILRVLHAAQRWPAGPF